jgi:hypothetical protein
MLQPDTRFFSEYRSLLTFELKALVYVTATSTKFEVTLSRATISEKDSIRSIKNILQLLQIRNAKTARHTLHKVTRACRTLPAYALVQVLMY